MTLTSQMMLRFKKNIEFCFIEDSGIIKSKDFKNNKFCPW